MKLGLVFAFAATTLIPATALAYPSAVVFSPNGEVKPLGQVGFLAYTSVNLSPSVSPGSTWFGLDVGLLPQFAYGNSGVSFGGLEMGFDITSGDGLVKPVLNGKLGLVTEGTFTPSVAVGLMEVSPALPSMNYAFVSATKTLKFSGASYGRLTLGLGDNAGSPSMFTGLFPFKDSRFALMAAYESPLLWDRVGLQIDHLGGTSEISDTYAGVTLTLSNTATVAAGAFLANDRNSPTDGFFCYVTESLDLLTLSAKP